VIFFVFLKKWIDEHQGDLYLQEEKE